jgi:hypothetical protein
MFSCLVLRKFNLRRHLRRHETKKPKVRVPHTGREDRQSTPTRLAGGLHQLLISDYG